MVVPTRSQQAGLAAAVALDADRDAAGQRGRDGGRARARCARAPSRAAARDDAQGRFAGRRRGRLRRRRDRRLGRARGDAGARVLASLARDAELLTCIAGDGAPLAEAEVPRTARRRRRARVVRGRASRATGGCWRPSSDPAGRGAVPPGGAIITTCPRPSPPPTRLDLDALRARARPLAAPRAARTAPELRGGPQVAEARASARARHGRRPARAPAARPPRGAHDRRAAARRGRRPSSSRSARSLAAVRRRGMKPLVEAIVADATGVMKATFFNQPWLGAPVPARDAADARTASTRAATASGSARHARDRRGVGAAGGRRRSRTTRPPRASPRRRSWRSCASTAPRSPT